MSTTWVHCNTGSYQAYLSITIPINVRIPPALQTRYMHVNPGSQVENLVFIKESLTQILQSANMYSRHLLASLPIERSTSDLHCIFLERPARQSANMSLRCGRGIHRRRDSATCAYPGTRMQRPFYLVWTVNNTRHLC